MSVVLAVFAFIGICAVGIAVGVGLFVGGLLLYDRVVVSQIRRR